METQKTFRTSDRALVTWLRYLGYKHVKTVLEGRKVWFYYEDTDELQKNVLGYHNQDVYDVSPFVLFKQLGSVTDIIYQVKNQDG